MFPIYGLAAFWTPIYKKLSSKSMWRRGLLYTLAIFGNEFLFGSLLKKRNLCPWDYNGKPYNVRGLIRLDYAPFWFGTGLLFEAFLKKDDSKHHHVSK